MTTTTIFLIVLGIFLIATLFFVIPYVFGKKQKSKNKKSKYVDHRGFRDEYTVESHKDQDEIDLLEDVVTAYAIGEFLEGDDQEIVDEEGNDVVQIEKDEELKFGDGGFGGGGAGSSWDDGDSWGSNSDDSGSWDSSDDW